MLNFVAKFFRVLVEVLLWIGLVVCAGAGWMSGRGSIAYGFLGLLIGLFVWLVISVLVGGTLVSFLSLCKDVKNMNKWLQYIWEHKIITDAAQKTPGPLYDADVHYFADRDELEGKGGFGGKNELDLDDL